MDVDDFLQQKAVYWPPGPHDNSGGIALYEPPVELDCRWEDIAEQFINKNGETVVSKSKIFFQDKVEQDGVVKLGGFSTVTNLTDPFDNEGAWEIQSVSSLPDEEGEIIVYIVML